MASGILSEVLEFVPDGIRYVERNFGLDSGTAADVVQDVLGRLTRSDKEYLENPRRYFLRSCRWRALQAQRKLRRWGASAPIDEPSADREILVALEDEDKAKFFGQPVPGAAAVEVEVSLEIHESPIRVRVHVSRQRPCADVA